MHETLLRRTLQGFEYYSSKQNDHANAAPPPQEIPLNNNNAAPLNKNPLRHSLLPASKSIKPMPRLIMPLPKHTIPNASAVSPAPENSELFATMISIVIRIATAI